MESGSRFIPGMITGWGNHLIAVDSVQPVGAVLSKSGETLGFYSWANIVDRPDRWMEWPGRAILGLGDRRWLHERNAGQYVYLGQISDPQLRLDSCGSVPEGAISIAHDRFSLSRTVEIGGVEVSAATNRESNGAWEAVISVGDGQNWVEALRCSRSSVVAVAAVEEYAFVLIREGVRRPWTFDPQTRIVRVDEGGQILDVPVSEGQWKPWRVDPDGNSRIGELHAYLSYTLAEMGVVRRHGGQAQSILVEGLDRPDPRVRSLFDLEGKSFERIDRPFNRLGIFSGGLQRISVFVDEDLSSMSAPFGEFSDETKRWRI